MCRWWGRGPRPARGRSPSQAGSQTTSYTTHNSSTIGNARLFAICCSDTSVYTLQPPPPTHTHTSGQHTLLAEFCTGAWMRRDFAVHKGSEVHCRTSLALPNKLPPHLTLSLNAFTRLLNTSFSALICFSAAASLRASSLASAADRAAVSSASSLPPAAAAAVLAGAGGPVCTSTSNNVKV